jgi:hypothetical protein
MAHETVVGKNQYIYSITLPGTFTPVISLMSPAALAEIGSYDVLDGYIVCESGDFHIAHDPTLTVGTIEPFTANGYAFFPFHEWHRKVYIRTSGGSTTARLKLMTGFITRNN